MLCPLDRRGHSFGHFRSQQSHPRPGMIHGEQKITYHRQLLVGESFMCKRRVKDVYERSGKLGKMTFVVLESTGHDLAGNLVFSSSSTLIAPVFWHIENGIRHAPLVWCMPNFL